MQEFLYLSKLLIFVAQKQIINLTEQKVLKDILKVVTAIQKDVTSLKKDVADIKKDISTLKKDVADIKSDIKEINRVIPIPMEKSRTIKTRSNSLPAHA